MDETDQLISHLRGYGTRMTDNAADEIERLRAAAKPFADHGWYDAELEDDNCPLVRHSGPVTVGHWRALRAALGMKP